VASRTHVGPGRVRTEGGPDADVYTAGWCSCSARPAVRKRSYAWSRLEDAYRTSEHGQLPSLR
jgi:hypothetical protein